MKLYASTVVQGIHEGQRGTFLRNDRGEALSPIFDGLYQLYPWMRAQGWVTDTDDNGTYRPWRVSKETTSPASSD